MFINKIGYNHIEFGTNNQDFGFENDTIKCVVDGCSEGKHSEVGAKIFCHLFNSFNAMTSRDSEGCVQFLFERMMEFIGHSPTTIRDFMCFTILQVIETDNEFIVNICGDGYIIKHTIDDKIEYEKIDNGEYPIYFAYNYVPEEYLELYKDGVRFKEYRFSKEEYKAIGVASDGLRYIFNTDFEEEFTESLLNRKINKLKRLINREQIHFKDDITLVI